MRHPSGRTTTAHDKDGKLVFDGEIDTPEQRAKVPPELWEKVKPLLDKVAPQAEEEPETNPAPSSGTSSFNPHPGAWAGSQWQPATGVAAGS